MGHPTLWWGREGGRIVVWHTGLEGLQRAAASGADKRHSHGARSEQGKQGLTGGPAHCNSTNFNLFK
jgi:hypothetical protein